MTFGQNNIFHSSFVEPHITSNSRRSDEMVNKSILRNKSFNISTVNENKTFFPTDTTNDEFRQTEMENSDNSATDSSVNVTHLNFTLTDSGNLKFIKNISGDDISTYILHTN